MTSIASGGVQAKPTGTITREAARDLSDYQYHAMKIDTDSQIDYVDTSSAGVCIGVLQNAPDAAGEEAEVATEGTSLLYVDGNSTSIAEGDPLASNSNYHGHKADSDQEQFFAIALQPSTADGDLIEVMLVGPSYLAV